MLAASPVGLLGLTNPLALLGPLGPMEVVLILLVVVVIFGARRLPELGRGVGEAIRNFKGSMKEIEADAEGSGASETSKS
jgi:sec-independent protein translocase protein TatA